MNHEIKEPIGSLRISKDVLGYDRRKRNRRKLKA